MIYFLTQDVYVIKENQLKKKKKESQSFHELRRYMCT